MRKRHAVRRMVLWTIVALALCGALLYGLDGRGVFDRRQRNAAAPRTVVAHGAGDDTDTILISGSSIRKIDIDWVSGSVVVEQGTGSDIMLRETASRALDSDEQMRYHVDGDTLKIEFTGKKSGLESLFSWTPGKTLTVSVPPSVSLEEIDIESVSAEVTLDAGTRRVRQLDMETVSGAIDVTGSFETVDIEGVSANVTLSLPITPDELKVQTVSGNTDVYLAQDRGFYAKLDSVSGGISSDFATQDGGKALRFGDEACTLKFESVSGNVHLRYDEALAPAPEPETDSSPVAVSPAPSPSGSKDPVPSSHRKF